MITATPRSATVPQFALGDRVRIAQSGIRDEYADKAGVVSGMNFWNRGGWHYELRLDAPTYTRAFAVFAERELVAETAVGA